VIHRSSRLFHIVLFVGSIVFLMPFYVMVVMSLKTPEEIARSPIWQWPAAPSLSNFVEVLQNPGVVFSLLLKNTAFLAVMCTIGTLLSSITTAYAFARLKFPGKDRLFVLLLATMMLPGIVTMIPTYVLYAKLHWINSFLPLIVPTFFGSAWNIFLLKQFFSGLPMELDEAALMDGAGHLTILSRVVLPLSGPVLATIGTFTFIGAWRDFMGPLLYLNDPDKQTLEVGLRLYKTMNEDQWHLLMAAAVMVTIPLIIIFLVSQKAFVKGIVMTGGK
jgi:ABC-type glycerol-3-phosphate transport system permease component